MSKGRAEVSEEAVRALAASRWERNRMETEPEFARLPTGNKRSLLSAAQQDLTAALPALHKAWLEDFKERLLGEEARAVVVDFLDSWRFCPVSRASTPSRSCLDDAAKQLLAALQAASTPEEGE